MYEFDWSSIVPSMPYLLAGLVITLKSPLPPSSSVSSGVRCWP